MEDFEKLGQFYLGDKMIFDGSSEKIWSCTIRKTLLPMESVWE